MTSPVIERIRPDLKPRYPLRVLTFTTLFPNAAQPSHGKFVCARVGAMASLCELRVVAPVPWILNSTVMPARYQTGRQVPALETQDGMPVLHPRFFTIPKLAKSLDGLFLAQSCQRVVTKLRSKFPFDVIDAHWAYPDGVAAALIGRQLRVPVSITVRGDDINVFAKEALRRPWIRWALNQASLVVAVSDELKNAVMTLCGRNAPVVVVPNGVDTRMFVPMDKEIARQRLAITRNTTLLLSAGRLHRSKGYSTVVGALATLKDRYPGIRLVIVGAPDPEADATPDILRVAADLGVAGHVTLTGSQSRDELVTWYSAADAFCLATTREGSPNVLREALACGVPCIATAVGDIPSLISESVGALAEGTPAGFAAALDRVLQRNWDREQLRRVAALRSWQNVALECCDALRGIAPRLPHAQ